MCVCVVVLVYMFESVEPSSLPLQSIFLPLSLYTHANTHTSYRNLFHSKKARSRWSIVWVLFSTVTAGWDNGEQLNCTQLIYFYLRKQIGCSAREGGLSLKTPQKGPQRQATREETSFLPNFVNYSCNYWDPFPLY